MEKYSLLQNLPTEVEIKDDDVIVTGKRIVHEGEVRHQAHSVKAGEYKKAMVNLVLSTADLPSHLEAMDAEIKKAASSATTATTEAGKAKSEASKSAQSQSVSTQQANISTEQANLAKGSVNAALAHVETCEDLEALTQRHADAANNSKAAAADSAVTADLNAGYFATAISLMINNSYHLVKTNPMM